MREWLFSDMSWLFFATWSLIVAAVSFAAFRRDAVPSKASTPNEAVPRVSTLDSHAR
jgi:hypothetical protein